MTNLSLKKMMMMAMMALAFYFYTIDDDTTPSTTSFGVVHAWVGSFAPLSSQPTKLRTTTRSTIITTLAPSTQSLSSQISPFTTGTGTSTRFSNPYSRHHHQYHQSIAATSSSSCLFGSRGGGGGDSRDDSSYKHHLDQNSVTKQRSTLTIASSSSTSSTQLLSSSSSSSETTTSSSNNNNDNNNSIDWKKLSHEIKVFWKMAYPYFEESNAGRWLFAGMIGLTLLNSGVSVVFSYLGKDFWNALSAKNTAEFYTVLSKYVGALVLGAPIVTLYKYQRERLSIHWREWMTERMLQLYEYNRVYYTLEQFGRNNQQQQQQPGGGDNISSNNLGGTDTTTTTSTTIPLQEEIDNPDQRICEDVKSFTSFSLQLFLTVVTSIIDLVSFSFILYSIYPQLFVAIVLYAAFGTVTTTWLGKDLVRLNYDQLTKEANFRYSLVRWRGTSGLLVWNLEFGVLFRWISSISGTVMIGNFSNIYHQLISHLKFIDMVVMDLLDNAESIAFYGGEDLENKAIGQRLGYVLENGRNLIATTRYE